MYIDALGPWSFTGKLDRFRYILGDVTHEQLLLDYVTAHGIHGLSLYDLGMILGDVTLESALVSFMTRARQAGVTTIEAIGNTHASLWDNIATFHKTRARFDGILTEIEFWNGGSIQDATDALRYIEAKQLVRSDGSPISYASYIGWATASDIAALAPLVDRLYVHAYVTQADQAFGFISARVANIVSANASAGRDVEVVPIFSAEGVQWAADPFMGDWLAANSIAQAESTFLSDWESAAPAVRLMGFQYYEYFYLAQYVP